MLARQVATNWAAASVRAIFEFLGFPRDLLLELGDELRFVVQVAQVEARRALANAVDHRDGQAALGCLQFEQYSTSP